MGATGLLPSLFLLGSSGTERLALGRGALALHGPPQFLRASCLPPKGPGAGEAPDCWCCLRLSCLMRAEQRSLALPSKLLWHTIAFRIVMPCCPPMQPCANSLATIRLWLQRFAPAHPVVALACQLGEIFRIGTGGATVFFGVIGHTVASGMGTFRFRNHGSSCSQKAIWIVERGLARRACP